MAFYDEGYNSFNYKDFVEVKKNFEKFNSIKEINEDGGASKLNLKLMSFIYALDSKISAKDLAYADFVKKMGGEKNCAEVLTYLCGYVKKLEGKTVDDIKIGQDITIGLKKKFDRFDELLSAASPKEKENGAFVFGKFAEAEGVIEKEEKPEIKDEAKPEIKEEAKPVAKVMVKPLVKKVPSVSEMIKSLGNADSMFRGSSDAYKDIQKELKQLKAYENTFKTAEEFNNSKIAHKYVSAVVDSIIEKAEKYVYDRRKVKASPDSYKGKRINAVKNLITSLKAYSDPFKNAEIKDGLMTDAENEAYVDMLTKHFNSSKYSVALFRKCCEAKNKFVNCDRNDDIKDAYAIMKKVLGNEKVSFDKAFNYTKDMVKSIAESREHEAIPENHIKDLKTKAKNLSEDQAKIDFLNGKAFDPDNYPGRITGNIELDRALVEFELNRMHKALEAHKSGIEINNQ